MNKKKVKSMLAVALLTSIMTLVTIVPTKAQSLQVTRLGGEDRYETSTKIVQEYMNVEQSHRNYPATYNVYLTTGEDFRFAVPMTALSYNNMGVCLIINPNGELNNHVRNFMSKMRDDSKETFFTQLAGEDLMVSTKADGPFLGYKPQVNTAFNVLGVPETSVFAYYGYDGQKCYPSLDIGQWLTGSKALTPQPGKAGIVDYGKDGVIYADGKIGDTIMLANVDSYADILAASTFSAKYGIPIFLTNKDEVGDGCTHLLNYRTLEKDNVMLKWLSAEKHINSGFKTKNVIVLGGTGVVSDSVVQQLQNIGLNIIRLQGEDRYHTAMNIINYFDNGTHKGLILTSGKGFADSIVGSQLAAEASMPIMPYDEDSCSDDVKQFIKDRFKAGYVLGGEAVTPTASLKNLLGSDVTIVRK